MTGYHLLKEIADIIMGQSPPSSTYNKEESGLPFFQGKAEFGIRNPVPTKWCVAPMKIAEPEDILISVRAPVGPTNICSVKSCIGRGLAAIRPKRGKMDYRFLWFYLRHIEDRISQKGVGSTFAAIGKNQLSIIPVPDLDYRNQIQIADILEKAESAREKRQEANRLTDEFLKSTFLEMFGDPITNPRRWEIAKLGELGNGKNAIVDGPFGSSIDTKVDYIDYGDIPVIRTKNVKPFNFIIDDLKFINRAKFEKIKRSKVVPGDIVLTKVGTIGNVCIFPNIFKEAVLSTTGSCKITPDKAKINKVYLLYFLHLYKPKMLQIASQGVQAFLNMKHIKNFRVPKPPMDLQNIFSSIVSKTDKLREKQRESEKELDNLFNSFMQKAFRGELVN